MSGKRYISSFSVIVSFISLALLGGVLMPLLPVKLVPSETLPAISVSFSMPSSSARNIESEVTSRLEAVLSRVSGVKSINSRSSSGSGHITLEFDQNTDMQVARFEAAMIVRQLWESLPEGVSYPTINMQQVDNKAALPFMSYTINADLLPAQIMQYADDNIRPRLSRIPGVAKVELSGATPMEWSIEYDTRTMDILGITPSQIHSAISAYYGSEFLKIAPFKASEDNNWVRIAIANPAGETIPDLKRITVGNHKGEVITLDKIARLSYIESPPQSYYRINGLNSIYLNITSTDDANQIDLSLKIREALASMPSPCGYMLELNYDGSENISKELDKIYLRTSLTWLILLVFVGLITLSWRYLWLITVSLAINMAIAFAAYYLLKVEIQLYSLAGITISLNLVIDNLIVMAEHVTRRHNLKAFPAVLAATLTTIGALSVIFFLDDKTMLNLKDFVIVVIVNLGVSLLTALFLVPALIERLKIRKKQSTNRRLRRANVNTMRIYTAIVRFLTRHKKLVYLVFVLSFGLPVFLLPELIQGEGTLVSLYNTTFGSQLYKETLRPWVDRSLGGSLRLFVDKVNNGYYFNREDNEPVVSISAALPNGSTLQQMNSLIQKMERFIATQEGVRQFHTSIYGPRRSCITVYFKPEYQNSGYPYRFKSNVISKALTLGGGGWNVYGLEDMGFNNDVHESAGSYRIRLMGYNYDELYRNAEVLRDTLLMHKRIKEVFINSEFSYWKNDYTEFYLDINKERLTHDSLSVNSIFNVVAQELNRNQSVWTLSTEHGSEMIKLSSDTRDRDVWSLMNVPLVIGKKRVKLADYASIQQRQTPQDIVKNNQEYVLCVQYEYIGSNKQGTRLLESTVERFNETLPLGYRAEVDSSRWDFRQDAQHYALLGLIAIIIFFVSSILFNSLRQPLAIIFMIPVSFIGVFLTFYIFDLKFDQGGFASFILLCGITINAAIYIINEYNSLYRSYPFVSRQKLYIKAFRTKITTVMLTILSTVLGFIPFLVGDTRESFWFPLAAGTMGGLILSLSAILFLLPAILLRLNKTEDRANH